MPGISVLTTLRPASQDKADLAAEAARAATGFPHHTRTLLDTPAHQVVTTGYDGYPVMSFDAGAYWVCLEGRLYGKDESSCREELVSLAEKALGRPDRATDGLCAWLLDTDGDFVVLAVNKETGALALFNDALGRLPIYYHAGETRFVASRQIGLVVALAGHGLDRMGMAQALLLRYPLGRRTLYRGVSRLASGTLVRIDPGEPKAQFVNLHTFNFDTTSETGQGVSGRADSLAMLFREACERRAQPGRRCVLALSGGLDSRAVAAGLGSRGIDFCAMTYVDPDGVCRGDPPIAQRVAAVFHAEWRAVALCPPRGSHLLDVLALKRGMAWLHWATLLQFMEAVREEYGAQVLLVTGDGGDKVLPGLQPGRRFDDVRALTRYLVAHNGVLGLNETVALTGVSAEGILAEIDSLLATYPEQALARKYVHFLLCERAGKWLFEAEDMYRAYLWSVAPFYAMPVFRCAMGCPGDQKSGHELYRRFLLALSPEVCRLREVDFGVPITSFRYRAARRIVLLLERFPGVWRSVRRLYAPAMHRQSFAPGSTTLACLAEQARDSDPVRDCLSHTAIQRMVERPERYTRSAFRSLLTLTSAIECQDGIRQTLAKYRDAEFG